MPRFPAHSRRPDKAEQFTLMQSKNPWNPVSVTLPQKKTSSLNTSPPTAARGAAGVTPAPSVHSIQAQNPADGILLSAHSERSTISKICAAHIFGMGHWVQGSAPCAGGDAAHRAGDLTDLETAIRFGSEFREIPHLSEPSRDREKSNIPLGFCFTAEQIYTAYSLLIPPQPFT